MSHWRNHWWLPLVVFSGVVVLDWLRLHHNGIATSAESRRLFLAIGSAIVIAVVIKLVFSRAWPLQELGHLGVLAGIAGLSLRIIGRFGPQPVPEWQRDIIQALLDVGAAALSVGMVLWVIFHGRKGETGEETDTVLSHGFDRRQGPKDRRSP